MPALAGDGAGAPAIGGTIVRRKLTALLSLVLVAGCGSITKADTSPAATTRAAPATTAVVQAAPAVTSTAPVTALPATTATVLPATTVAIAETATVTVQAAPAEAPTTPTPSTTSAPTATAATEPVPVAPSSTVPGNLLDDCVNYVELSAFLGDAEMRTMWDASGQNEGAQRLVCESMGETDPAAISNMSTKLVVLERSVAAATTTTEPAPTLPPPTAPRTTAPRPAPKPTPTTASKPDNGGATAVCRDGTLSYSAHRSGTCSHHGGVAQWL
jgi:hypothetical protein